jgi:hypothetical protein
MGPTNKLAILKGTFSINFASDIIRIRISNELKTGTQRIP